MSIFLPVDDSKLLNKLCDDIINMEISPEDLLEEDEHMVSSTEVSPVKVPPSTSRKSSTSSRVLKMSKQLKEAELMSEVASVQSALKGAHHEDDVLELAPKGQKNKRAILKTSESQPEFDSGKNAEVIELASKRAHQLFAKNSKVKRAKPYCDDDDLELAYTGRKIYKRATLKTSEIEDELDPSTLRKEVASKGRKKYKQATLETSESEDELDSPAFEKESGLEVSSKGRKKHKQAMLESSESEEEIASPTSGEKAELRRALSEINQLKKLEERVKSGKLIH